MGNEAENTESEAQIQDLKGNGGNQKGKSTLGMKQVTDSALDKIEEMIKKFHTTLPSMSNKGSQGVGVRSAVEPECLFQVTILISFCRLLISGILVVADHWHRLRSKT